MGKGLADRSEAADREHGQGYTVRRLSNYTEVLSRLKARNSYAIPALAYLEPRYLPFVQWYLATAGSTESEALCLYLSGTHGSTVYTMGNSVGLEHIFNAHKGPRTPYLIYEAHHVETLGKYYLLQKRQRLVRMVVNRESFRPAPTDHAVPLKPENNVDVSNLYRSEGGGWFSRQYLAEGVYYGIWQDGILVSVAGTQSISKTYGTAMVANVLTDPAYRGRGYATECTSAVTARLIEICSTVGLNVEVDNAPAIKVYEKLGYRLTDHLEEAWGLRKGGLFGFIAGFFEGITRKIN